MSLQPIVSSNWLLKTTPTLIDLMHSCDWLRPRPQPLPSCSLAGVCVFVCVERLSALERVCKQPKKSHFICSHHCWVFVLLSLLNNRKWCHQMSFYGIQGEKKNDYALIGLSYRSSPRRKMSALTQSCKSRSQLISKSKENKKITSV